jgi:hypothetical protein
VAFVVVTSILSVMKFSSFSVFIETPDIIEAHSIIFLKKEKKLTIDLMIYIS